MRTKQFNQKQKLAILESAKKVGIKEAARMAGIHYTSVYQWRRRFEAMGEEGFLSYKPASPGRGVKKITAQQEEAVLSTWHSHSSFGPGQVRNQLRRQGITVSTKTVRQIMEANGYQVPRKRQKKDKGQRFEARRPLELAQMDILEFFINKLKVYVILLLDDFSRFILGWRLLEETSIDAVIGLVQDAIDRYGKMVEILTDRGFVFYSWRGVNRFERYLELEGIDHTHARPHHPQTLGKVEACNRRIKRELFDRERFLNAHDADAAIEKWVNHYNYERTHQGIGGLLVPAERFHGQSKQVISAISQGIDIVDQNCYPARGIERSIFNIVLAPDGKTTLYVLGQPIVIERGSNAGKLDS
jgi:transposase InsO family protein